MIINNAMITNLTTNPATTSGMITIKVIIVNIKVTIKTTKAISAIIKVTIVVNMKITNVMEAVTIIIIIIINATRSVINKIIRKGLSKRT